jgi:hypothetical protein
VGKKRRVELHIEHDEISTFAGSPTLADPTIDFRQSDPASFFVVRHVSCLTNAISDLALSTDAVTHSSLDLSALNQRMQDVSVHFRRSPSSERWICTKSLHQS